jgi:hypothetical protein
MSLIIEQTRQYIRDFDRFAETTNTAQELYDKMLELHPAPGQSRVGAMEVSTRRQALSPQRVRREQKHLRCFGRNCVGAEPSRVGY